MTEHIASFDMNGPLTSTETSALDPFDKAYEAFEELDDAVQPVINSGYDTTSLRQFREKLGEDVPLLGELGTVWDESGEVTQLVEGDHSDIYDIHEEIYRTAVREGLKVHQQGNQSDVVGCTRIEARDSTADHPLFEDARPYDLYESLDHDDFEFEGLWITFEPERELIEELSDTLRYDHTYLGVRFMEVDEDRWAVYPDPEDRPGVDIEDAHAYLTEAIEEHGFRAETNADWGADYIKNGFGKQDGIQQVTDGHIHHIGDKQSDVMVGDNVTFYPLVGTEAHEYAEEHGIEHTPVNDVLEYVSLVNERVEG